LEFGDLRFEISKLRFEILEVSVSFTDVWFSVLLISQSKFFPKQKEIIAYAFLRNPTLNSTSLLKLLFIRSIGDSVFNGRQKRKRWKDHQPAKRQSPENAKRPSEEAGR